MSVLFPIGPCAFARRGARLPREHTPGDPGCAARGRDFARALARAAPAGAGRPARRPRRAGLASVTLPNRRPDDPEKSGFLPALSDRLTVICGKIAP